MSQLSSGSRTGGSTNYHEANSSATAISSRGPFGSLKAMEDALRAEITGAASSFVPECTTLEVSLGPNATVPLHRPSIGPYAKGGNRDLPIQFRTTTKSAESDSTCPPAPEATVSSLIHATDAQDRQIVQRAASRGIVSAIQEVDGFRYSFNNAWSAKDEEGSRFSYICQDSIQNKDRHANGFTRTLKHLKGDGERGPRMPTFDCKGTVSVKFSSGRECVDVHYRHYAIHRKVAERLPLSHSSTRSKDIGKLRKQPEVNVHGNTTFRPVNSGLSSSSQLPTQTASSSTTRPLKRKRDAEPHPMAGKHSNVPPSLADLLKQTDTANASLVHYDIPSWQKPASRAWPPEEAGRGSPDQGPKSKSTKYAELDTNFNAARLKRET